MVAVFRAELGGGSAGGGSRPRRLFSFLASDRRARGAGGLRAGWWRWFGWPFGAGGWFATHRRAKALFRLPPGTEDDDVPRRRVLLEGVFVAVLLLRRLGSSGGNPRSRVGSGEAAFLRRLPLGASLLDVPLAGGTSGVQWWLAAASFAIG